MSTKLMNETVDERILAADLVVAVKDGECEVLKSRYAKPGKKTLPEVRRLLDDAAKRN